MMLELALQNYAFGLTYAQKLVADVPDEQMCAQPVPGRVMNHPAWLLGHLAWASENGTAFLGQTSPWGVEWRELFGMGTTPQTERSRYPAKAELLRRLEEAHAHLAATVGKATPEVLAQPAPERLRGRFPTVGNVLLGLMTSHESLHLGQMSAWRRALGLPSVF
jgi:hypothetical protein